MPTHLSAKRERRVVSRADSLMQQIIRKAPDYVHALTRYDATVVMRGGTKVDKFNSLFPYAHLLFPINKDAQDHDFTLTARTQFEAPNHYQNEILTLQADRDVNYNLYKEAFQLTNLNIYSPTIYQKQMITPLSPDAFDYYTFTLVSESTDSTGRSRYDIHFTPRQWSQRLFTGNLLLTDGTWDVERLYLQGRTSFEDYSLNIRFYSDSICRTLPQAISLVTQYHCFGNRFTTDLHTELSYQAVDWTAPVEQGQAPEQLDLTRYHTITVPPTEETGEAQDTTTLLPAEEIRRQLTSPLNMEYKGTRFKYSGLLNPFQLSLGSGGVTYKQEVRLSKQLGNDRQLRFHPTLGYLFGDHSLRYEIETDWDYHPLRMGTLHLSLSNTDQTYTQQERSKLYTEPENIQYFRHHIFELANQIELANGWIWTAGVTYHLHKPIHPKENTVSKLNDFIPFIGFSYTPHQRYWFDGLRKEYLTSPFPTFRLRLARSFSHVMGSDTRFWRTEAGLNQTIPIGLTRKLSYNFSSGIFFGAKNDTYFADFRFFAKKYFPEPWSDRFGGTFHNLDRDYYYASDKYIQLHAMLESPFILMRLFRPKLHRFIVSERFYWSHLWTPVLHKYGEIGYGIGSDLLHAGVFFGFRDFQYENFGVKIALDLFR